MPRLAPAAGPRRAVVAKPWVWRVQAMVSSYLPLLLMAMLATGTNWLVKNTPAPETQQALPPPSHDADYQMQDFVLQRFTPAGTLNVEIIGHELRHYPDTDTIEIDDARVRALVADGSVATGTAKRAVSNADGSEIQMLGDVHLVREATLATATQPARPALEVSGDFLQIFVNTEQMQSTLPAHISYGTAKLDVQNFVLDNLHGRLAFAGRGVAQLQPQPRR